jgi:ABC-type nitrate/sulfonate/bicarbonate transport system substrate-binding protein
MDDLLTCRIQARKRLAAFLLLGFLIVGIFPFDVPSYSSSQVGLSVFLPPRPDYGAVGIATALKADIFALEALQVRLNYANSEESVIESVVEDPSAVGLVSATNFLKARARGLPIVAFAAGYLETPVVFYVLESSQIRTPSDFLGKRIGYGSGDERQFAYEIMMLRLHLPRSQIREVNGFESATPLANDSLDVWPGIIGEASAALREKGVRFRAIRPSDSGVHILGTVFFCNQDALKQFRDSLTDFMRGVIAGWDFVYTNLGKQTSDGIFGPAYSNAVINFVMDEQRSYIRPFGLRIGEFDRQQWKATQDALVDVQLLHRPMDISRFADFEIIKDAYRKTKP